MRLDLRGVGVPLQAQVVLDELLGVGFPVDLRVGGQVGVVVAHGAVDLAQQRYGGHLGDLPLQAVDHVGQFLAQSGRRGRLAMGARQHRHAGELDSQCADGVGDLFHQRQQNGVAAFAQHQGVGQVVDVLGGAGEVDEFADRGQFRQLGGLLLEEVFHGLDVVVGGALDLFHTLGVFDGEVLRQLVEQGVGFGGEGRHFGDAFMGGQALQPADFDQNAITDQAVLTEDRAQRCSFAGIAAIDGGNGGERGKLHGSFSAVGRRKGRALYLKLEVASLAGGAAPPEA